jgi:SAM-dependent methyltransferase
LAISTISPILEQALGFASPAELGDLQFFSQYPETWGDDIDFAIGAEATDAGRILPTYSSPRLVGWISALCREPQGVVLDPACGTGFLLSTVARGTANAAVRLVGIDNDPDAVRVSALRLLAHGRQAELLTGDALDPQGPMTAWRDACDLVVGDVPTGPTDDWSMLRTRFGRAPKNEQEFLWLASAIDALKVGGRAVICTPARALESPGRAARFRSSFVEQGAITAVITLPAGMRPGAAPAMALWVLGKPETGPRPMLTINAAVLGQHAPDDETAQHTTAAAVEAFLHGAPLAPDLPFGAVRMIELSEALAESGFNFAPWSPAARDIESSPAPAVRGSQTEHMTDTPPDLWTELVAARQEFDTVMTALWERQREPHHATSSVTLDELMRREDVRMIRPPAVRNNASVGGAWTHATQTQAHPSGILDPVESLAELPTPGDVAFTRTEQSGVIKYSATVILMSSEAEDLPIGTIRLLRVRAGSHELSSEAIATAINAVAANGWPKGSRGDLDIERAASYIRVPLSGANELGLEAALHLRDRLEPLLNRLADPSHWT